MCCGHVASDAPDRSLRRSHDNHSSVTRPCGLSCSQTWSERRDDPWRTFASPIYFLGFWTIEISVAWRMAWEVYWQGEIRNWHLQWGMEKCIRGVEDIESSHKYTTREHSPYLLQHAHNDVIPLLSLCLFALLLINMTSMSRVLLSPWECEPFGYELLSLSHMHLQKLIWLFLKKLLWYLLVCDEATTLE